MGDKLVNLTVNPCKMCMPMGAVHAFYGIARCMTILHGSQGCSTYIRRHMATHFNEPVDIASSALTEEGTVYGGEKNLIKGIENLIRMYDPDVIGVATTCLAETIGENIGGIIKNFYDQFPESRVRLIPVSSGGYMGTQFEGYYKTLGSIVRSIEMKGEKHQKINVITGMLSPEDVRALKVLLEDFKLEYILLPDASDNLDGGFEENYLRLPGKGTTLDEIAQMAGSRLTVEINRFIDVNDSPGEFLKQTYGVPMVQIDPPVGLRDTDAFLDMLAEVSGNPVPDKYRKARTRYLDAMIDSHKYNAEGRAVIFGEPDFVCSVARLCCENGIIPVVCATGTSCGKLKELLAGEVASVSRSIHSEEYAIIDETDFERIEALAVKLRANLLIGSSDGRRIEEKHAIPLVRCAFPIHDRVGGQRVSTLGYLGSMSLLDSITNTLLHSKESRFRKEIYESFYKPNASNVKPFSQKAEFLTVKKPASDKHPCFSCSSAHQYARIHLPVAPSCNIQCNYCVRKYDCANESRPGVTTRILSPEEAVVRFTDAKKKLGNLTVVGIAGPGDALADFETTSQTLKLIRETDPDITFCLSTNGLALPQHIDELIALGISHVTITINAIDPEIGSRIYRYIDHMGMRFTGVAAASILISNQLTGLKLLASRGVVVKVNCVVLHGINDGHIEAVVKKVKELGAALTNIMQMIPVKGSQFETLDMVSMKTINEIRKRCESDLPQMYHCKQCRADAVGLLGDDQSLEFYGGVQPSVACKDTRKGLRFAVATKSGILVDEHFGKADEFLVYEFCEDQVRFNGKRKISPYCNGPEACSDEDDKISRTIKAIEDCDGVLALRIGSMPQKKLEDKGINTYMTYDRIEEAIIKIAKRLTGEEAV